MARISLFDRGEERSVEVKFNRPIELPREFWVALDFRAHATKGVYVSYDTSTGGKFSRWFAGCSSQGDRRRRRLDDRSRGLAK